MPRIAATTPSVPSVYVATRRCSECEARGRTCASSQNRSVLVARRAWLARSDLDRTPARPRIGQIPRAVQRAPRDWPRARAVFPWARRAIRSPRGSGTARDRTRKLSLPRPQAPRPLQAPCPGHARGESGGPGPSSGFRQSEARYKCAQPVLAIVRRAGGRCGGGEHVHLPGRALGMGAGGDVGDRRRLGLV